MRRDRARAALHDESGAALIEAALVLPILIVLVFAVVEASLYAWQLNLAQKAVQLGLRRAIVSDAVAVGPGLTPSQSDDYWNGLPAGERCAVEPEGRGLCPTIVVVCDLAGGCRCRAGACGFAFSRPRLEPILAAMRAVLPALRPENVELGYATNGFGYVGRPVPVPVDVTVRLLGFTYDPIFPGILLGAVLPIAASATLPGEALVTR